MTPTFYRTIQHLSIDIVLGAVILLHFFSKIYKVQPDWYSYVLLGSAIWIIYTIDHLRDAIAAKNSLRARYSFHAKHRKKLKVGILVVVGLSIGCLFFLPLPTLIAGAILSVFCFLYVLFQSTLAQKGWKEFYVAVIYTLGILLTPISLSREFDTFSFITLFILAFLNLIIFSWFEFEEDRDDEFLSIATQLGKGNVEKLVLIVASIGLSIGLLGLDFSLTHSTYALFSILIFVLLTYNKAWAKRNSRYRTIGDGLFLIPIIFELL